MSEASDKLTRSRQAIIEQVARKQRRHDPREVVPGQGFSPGSGSAEDDAQPGSGWFGHFGHAVKTWWRYHPAHMAVEIVSPLMRSYASRRPVQLLAISTAAGALLVIARPWRLISITTLLIAVLKSSQLSSLFMAAMSAADYRKDQDRPV